MNFTSPTRKKRIDPKRNDVKMCVCVGVCVCVFPLLVLKGIYHRCVLLFSLFGIQEESAGNMLFLVWGVWLQTKERVWYMPAALR